MENIEKKREYNRKHYLENPESYNKWSKEHPKELKEIQRRWYLKNPDYSKRYYKEHTEAVKKIKKRWVDNNRILNKEIKKRWETKHPEYKKKWSKEHPEKCKESKSRWAKNNPERNNRWKKEHPIESKIMKKVWELKNPEKCKESKSRWAKNNPDKVRQLHRKDESKRRIIIKGFNSTDGITKETQDYVLKRDRGLCVYCGVLTSETNNGDRLQTNYDHIIPISKLNPQIHLFNPNSIINLIIACKSCNSQRRNKDISQFCKEKNIPIPNIIMELLKKQKEQTKIGGG